MDIKNKGMAAVDHPHCFIYSPMSILYYMLIDSPSHLKYRRLPMLFYSLTVKESLTAYKNAGTAAADTMRKHTQLFRPRYTRILRPEHSAASR